MQIAVNGDAVVVGDGLTLLGLLQRLSLPVDGVAIAVNRAVIPKTEHAHHKLVSQDQVEIIRAVGGG